MDAASPSDRRRRAPSRYAARLIIFSLLVAVAALVCFGLLADEVFEGDTVRFDNAIRTAVHAHATPSLTVAMRAASTIGSAFVIGPLTILLIVLMWRVVRWPRAAALLAITMLGDVVLETTLKHFFRRPRPEAFFGLTAPHSWSFPSGHSMGSFCFFLVLAGLVAHRARTRAVRLGAWLSAVFLVAVIGYSRIYLGVHYPTDVLAGYAAAAVWVGTVVTVDGWRRRRAAARPSP